MKSDKEGPIGRVVKIHGWLDDNQTKAVASISWNDKTPRTEIRTIREKNGETHFGKGISIDDKEIPRLIEILTGLRGVDLDEAFAASSAIMENRKAGYTTEDGGRIVISPKR